VGTVSATVDNRMSLLLRRAARSSTLRYNVECSMLELGCQLPPVWAKTSLPVLGSGARPETHEGNRLRNAALRHG
jgi:hypothetical protein